MSPLTSIAVKQVGALVRAKTRRHVSGTGPERDGACRCRCSLTQQRQDSKSTSASAESFVECSKLSRRYLKHALCGNS